MSKENLYFIALTPQRELRNEIISFKTDLADRFGSKKALKVYPHITLKAPFKCTSNEHLHLMNWFADLKIDQAAFTIELRNFGAFHNKYNPVVFVNPVATTELYTIQKKVVTNFKSIFPQNIHPVDLKFKPHITIAYRDLEPRLFLKAWEEYKNKSYHTIFEVKGIYLLQHDTRQWNLISTCNLF